MAFCRNRILLFLLALAFGAAWAGAGDSYALLVAGTPDSAVYARRYNDWLSRMDGVLRKAGVPAKNIRVLSADPDYKATAVWASANAANLARAFTEIGGGMKPADRFFLVLFGHGVAGEKPPTFVVPGPQPSAEDFAKWLDALPAQNQIVLNFSASSGVFLPFLAKKGRINLSALAPTEGSEAVLPEFFLRGVEAGRADADKDGSVTLLEAFNWSAWEVAQWTNRQVQMGQFVTRGMKRVFVPRGDWRMDGKETVEIFHKLCDGADSDPGARKLAPESDGKGADPVVAIRPAGGQLTQEWTQRRILGEHAHLEDCGVAPGVTPILPWVPEGAEVPGTKPSGESGKPSGAAAGKSPEDRGFLPVDGKAAGAPGWLARGIVLSKR